MHPENLVAQALLFINNKKEFFSLKNENLKNYNII